MSRVVSKRSGANVVARVIGVQAGDDKVVAAERAIAVMKSAGMPTRKAEQMLKAYKQREGIA